MGFETNYRRLLFISKFGTKSLIAFIFAIVGMLFFSSSISAEESFDEEQVEKELEELNEVLDDMKDEINENLNDGKENFVVERDVDYSDEPVAFEIEGGSVVDQNDGELGTMNVSGSRTSNYTGTLSNPSTLPFGGLDSFSHELQIDWTYNVNTSQVTSVDTDPTLLGTTYMRDDTTFDNPRGENNSVYRVNSTGTFTPFNYPTLTYYTNFVIDVTATGNHNVIDLSVHS